MIDELQRVPENFAVDADASGGHHRTNEAAQREEYGDDDKLNVLSVEMLLSGIDRVQLAAPTLAHFSRISRVNF